MKRIIFILFFLSILKSTCLGQYSWSKVAGFDTTFHFFYITMVNNGDLYATGSDGSVKFLSRSIDHGLSWKKVNDSIPDDAHFIFGFGEKLFLSGSTLSVSVDNGQSWSSTNIVNGGWHCGPIADMANGELFLAANNYAMGADKLMFKSTDAGNSWSNIKLAGIDDVKYVKDLVESNGVLTAIYYDGPIESSLPYFSVDSGKTWQKSSINAFGSGFYRYTGFAKGKDREIFLFGSANFDDFTKIYRSQNDGISWEEITHSGFDHFVTKGVVVKTKQSFLIAGYRFNHPTQNQLYWSDNFTVIGENSDNERITIWPNPATVGISFSLQNDNSIRNFEILNSQGNLLLQGQKERSIDLEGYKSGIYFLKIMMEYGQVYVKRFIVIN
jgi:photosystem II stability/assembly factor-like uncharacterized protein